MKISRAKRQINYVGDSRDQECLVMPCGWENTAYNRLVHWLAVNVVLAEHNWCGHVAWGRARLVPPHAGHAVTVPESMLRDQRVLRCGNRVVTVRERIRYFLLMRYINLRLLLTRAQTNRFVTSWPSWQRTEHRWCKWKKHVCASRDMWSRIDNSASIRTPRDWFDNALAHSDVQFVLLHICCCRTCFSQLRYILHFIVVFTYLSGYS